MLLTTKLHNIKNIIAPGSNITSKPNMSAIAKKDGINSLKLGLLFPCKAANYLTKPAETDSSAMLLNAVRYFSSHSSKGTTKMCKSANYERRYEMHVLDQFHNR